MGGTLYTSWKDALGVSHIDEPVAVFENGKIYNATDGFLGTTAKGVLIGEYENGIVYTVGTGAFRYGKRLNAIAAIEHGQIYSLSKSILGGISKSLSVGECSAGKVYSHSHELIEGSESFGLYNGDEEGAAAAAAITLFKLESNVSAYDSSLNGEYSQHGSSSDDEDLWEKYGLFMPIVVTYRFFKYSFIVGKWIVGIVAWLTGGIIRLVQKHKEKSAFKEKETSTETFETGKYVDTADSSIFSDMSKDKEELKVDTTEKNPSKEFYPLDDDKEAVSSFNEKDNTESKVLEHIEKNNYKELTTKENVKTDTKKDEVQKSRLKSTMRTHSTGNTIEESDKFTPAGDL